MKVLDLTFRFDNTFHLTMPHGGTEHPTIHSTAKRLYLEHEGFRDLDQWEESGGGWT
jgi:hypothetical protein